MKYGLPDVAYLQITTLRGALGAVHWYGKITCGDKSVEVKAKLSKDEAKWLNEHDGFRKNSVFKYRAGQLSERIATRDAVIEAGIGLFEKEFVPLGSKYLLVSKPWVSHPRPIVAHHGDQKLVDEVNKLAQQAEDIGGWEGDKKRMTKIAQRWHQIERELGIL